MTDPLRDLASLSAATERLLATAHTLDNAAVAGPSRLPGWTRGHVLAHLSRNAEALVNVLEGRPMYASPEARDTDIERGAGRPLDVQLADVRDSAARLHAVASLPSDWERTVALRNGVTDRAARIPFRRLVEVELHHVDLGAGHELENLPEEFLLRETAFLADRFAGHPEVPPVRITASGGLGAWRTGRDGDGTGDDVAAVSVEGPPASLVGWLAGRRTGDAALTATGADGAPAALPALPAL
ncbi:maleylpyruvate isomerase family mycothiol-dependent enzyme [Streptomyces qinzhouensis]|uniref:Maleylpyruvate isomerase family mycothiol-dependent enzyme n=1 Tax=Streptomyces qinzhouensis TaxID=2599401 RepID=A0A5B8J8J5_9ACTN|nr:maleylpyruvate isomerase family mycothiol-dependent enzyme [Streptomyces qinzhouensis]QDY76221.1 maleylpyruvate isomerase family mycothiol-dependent enzyme [Streptomyces qinzhouensis]